MRYLSFISYTLSALGKVEYALAAPFQCDPTETKFADVCVANNTFVDGQLFLDDWRLNFTPFYVDLLALLVVIVACRVAAYLVLRYLRRPSI